MVTYKITGILIHKFKKNSKKVYYKFIGELLVALKYFDGPELTGMYSVMQSDWTYFSVMSSWIVLALAYTDEKRILVTSPKNEILEKISTNKHFFKIMY